MVRSLEVKKDFFHPKKDNEELLDLEVPYLSVIGALMYLANYTQPNITFLINLQNTTLHQLKDIGIESNMYYNNMGLFYLEGSESQS